MSRANADPRQTRDLNCKQYQRLLKLSKEYTESQSVVDLKEKLNAALASTSPPPPEGTKVQEINKLRNGGLVIQLMTKEATAWLCEPTNKSAFLNKFDTNASIKNKACPILVLRVPISFDPNKQEHLWKIEAVNDLPANT